MSNKKFLILGSGNYVGYKEIFPLLKENKVWLGYKRNKKIIFRYGSSIEKNKSKNTSNEKLQIFGNIRWFTNLGDIYRPEPLDLRGNYYSPEKYPEYDNYNAINVDKVADIPCDYAGVMGVPLTFMDKYNPEQFEIIWQASGNSQSSTPKHILNSLGYTNISESRGGCGLVDSKRKFSRILIRNKNPVVNDYRNISKTIPRCLGTAVVHTLNMKRGDKK